MRCDAPPTLADAEDVAAETFAIAWRKLDRSPRRSRCRGCTPSPGACSPTSAVDSGRRERLAALLRVEDVATPMRVGEDVEDRRSSPSRRCRPADQELLRLVAWEELGNLQIAPCSGSRRTPSPSACIAPGRASRTRSPDSRTTT